MRRKEKKSQKKREREGWEERAGRGASKKTSGGKREGDRITR